MTSEFDPYRKWLGIPPSEQPPNHYRLLGVGLFEDDADTIAGAADRQMAHVRTFQTGKHSELSQRLLNELSSARLCLLNPQSKHRYDAELKSTLSAHAAAAKPIVTIPVAAPLPRLARPPAGPFVEAKPRRVPSARRRAARPARQFAAITGGTVGLAILAAVAILSRPGAKTLHAPHVQRPAAVDDSHGRERSRSSAANKNVADRKKPAARLGQKGAAAPAASKTLDNARLTTKRPDGSGAARLFADTAKPPDTPGVVADKVEIWNQHNGWINDRGTREYVLRLFSHGREVWTGTPSALAWEPDRDLHATVSLPLVRFDRLRVDVTKWEQLGGGLAEIEVYRGPTNLARGAPATASAMLDLRFRPEKVTDGVTEGNVAQSGYWLLNDANKGWIEIDLALADVRPTSGVSADRLVVWNQHNSLHADRGTLAFDVILMRGAQEVWRRNDVELPWQADADLHVDLALPTDAFERLRIDVKRWHGAGGGLAEIEVWRGNVNLARACPAMASRSMAVLGHADSWDSAAVTDGITSSRDEATGYWLLPDNTAGWVEVDLSVNDADLGAAAGRLGAYHIATSGDWARGLAWLARCDDVELRSLARQDLSGPGDGAVVATIGDGWWNLAQQCSERVTRVLLGRALERYAQASPKLQGSQRERLSQRRKQAIADITPLVPLYLLEESDLRGILFDAPLREGPVIVGGVSSPHGLWMHPTAQSASHAAFSLARQFRRLRGSAAINDSALGQAETAMTFRIVADARPLWSSPPIGQSDAPASFDLDVTGVDKLELLVECPGGQRHCHAVWVEPRLER